MFRGASALSTLQLPVARRIILGEFPGVVANVVEAVPVEFSVSRKSANGKSVVISLVTNGEFLIGASISVWVAFTSFQLPVRLVMLLTDVPTISPNFSGLHDANASSEATAAAGVRQACRGFKVDCWQSNERAKHVDRPSARYSRLKHARKPANRRFTQSGGL